MNFDNHINEIEKKIGYTFKDKSLLRQAFTRSSFCNENKGKGGKAYQSNEVLEFFGDSLLSAAIVTLFMKDAAERYEYGISTALKEGDFSNIKSKLSEKKNLSVVTKKLGLQEYLLLGKGDAKKNIADEPSVMEDLFESIIGAIYIDSNNDMKKVIASVSRMLNVTEYLADNNAAAQSPKNALQEWCADKKHRMPAPVYKTISESGLDHEKIYERACYIGDEVYGTGKGKNLKSADACAAEEALARLIAIRDERNARNREEDNAEALRMLREIAQREKKPTPEFRDLGETERSSATKKEYEIECRFMGASVKGCGISKKDAKAASAKAMLKLLTKPKKQENSAKKRAPVSKKPAKKQKKSNRKGVLS